MNKHKQLFDKLFRNLVSVCRETSEHKGKICIEWPDGNAYWNKSEVKALIKQYDLTPVVFHGCGLGLTNEAGQLMNKPWKLMTNCKELRETFNGVVCNCEQEHAQCKGADCKIFENYTDKMVHKVHNAWEKHVNKARDN